MSATKHDPELLRLVAEVQAIDDLLGELQPRANASPIGSPQRRRYALLRDRQDLARRRLDARRSETPLP